MDLQDLLRLMRTNLPVSNAMGLAYDRFPPVGFENHYTQSWIYVPLILQAANGGVPVIDLHIPPDVLENYNQFVQRLQASNTLPPLPRLFQMFDSPFHIPSQLQIAILREADPTIGQEWDLFINGIYRQFASDSYWAAELPAGRDPEVSRLDLHTCPNPQRLNFSAGMLHPWHW